MELVGRRLIACCWGNCAGSYGEATRESSLVHGCCFSLDGYPPLHVGTSCSNGKLPTVQGSLFQQDINNIPSNSVTCHSYIG